jgi:hypothetical protein
MPDEETLKWFLRDRWGLSSSTQRSAVHMCCESAAMPRCALHVRAQQQHAVQCKDRLLHVLRQCHSAPMCSLYVMQHAVLCM